MHTCIWQFFTNSMTNDLPFPLCWHFFLFILNAWKSRHLLTTLFFPREPANNPFAPSHIVCHILGQKSPLKRQYLSFLFICGLYALTLSEQEDVGRNILKFQSIKYGRETEGKLTLGGAIFSLLRLESKMGRVSILAATLRRNQVTYLSKYLPWFAV